MCHISINASIYLGSFYLNFYYYNHVHYIYSNLSEYFLKEILLSGLSGSKGQHVENFYLYCQIALLERCKFSFPPVGYDRSYFFIPLIALGCWYFYSLSIRWEKNDIFVFL